MNLNKACEFINNCPVLDDPALGLPGEVGEVLELIKKDRRPGEWRKALDREKLALECYDVFFYLTRIIDDNALDWDDVITAGEKKLSKRFNIT